jgi:ABC-type amino acid transport system permease subunit
MSTTVYSARNIITMNAAQPEATHVAVRDGHVLGVVKDSSLVSVLGVNDITQLGKLHASSSFMTVETYNVVAVLYLMLTITLSLVLRQLERHMDNKNH